MSTLPLLVKKRNCMIVHLLALYWYAVDPVNSNTAGSRSWAELPRDAISGVARDFPLAVEPPNSYSTRGPSRPHIIPATQVGLLLGR